MPFFFRLLILIFCAFHPFLTHSQQHCKTASTSALQIFSRAQFANATSATPLYLKIYIHVIRKSDGTQGQLLSHALEGKRILNADFRMHNIYFIWDGQIDYIDNDTLFNNSTSIFNNNNHDDGIDIYLFDDSLMTNNGASGSSSFQMAGIWTDMVPSQSTVITHTISHEMGHVLDLGHSDDVHNFMAPGAPKYVEYFSTSQVTHMRTAIETLPYLQRTVTLCRSSDMRGIVGLSKLRSGQTGRYTVDNPCPNYTYTWYIKEYLWQMNRSRSLSLGRLLGQGESIGIEVLAHREYVLSVVVSDDSGVIKTLQTPVSCSDCGPLLLTEYAPKEEMVVYPNPSNGLMTVEISKHPLQKSKGNLDFRQNGVLTLIEENTGQVVYMQIVNDSSVKLNLPHKGRYLLLYDNGKQVIRKHLVNTDMQ